MKTQALVLKEVGAPFVLTEVEVDDPQDDEVLVEMVASGLCHTDLAIQLGEFPSAFPCIAGHEGAGKVIKIGSAVKRVAVGDSVLLSFAYCQDCHYCHKGHPAGCVTWMQRNFGRLRKDGPTGAYSTEGGENIQGHFFGQSSFSRHSLVSESSCVKVPAGADLKMLAPLGCGLQTGAGAVINVLKPPKNSSIAIFGLGAVGTAAMLASVYLGIEKIIVVDLVQSRLDFAKSVGATHAVLGSVEDVAGEIKKLTDGLGVEYAVEATGVKRVLASAYQSVANFGALASCGTPGPGHAPAFEIHEHVCSGKRYYGVTEGDSNPPEFIPFLMKLYEEGKFPVDKISATFPLEDFDGAVKAMKSGKTIKPIILF